MPNYKLMQNQKKLNLRLRKQQDFSCNLLQKLKLKQQKKKPKSLQTAKKAAKKLAVKEAKELAAAMAKEET